MLDIRNTLYNPVLIPRFRMEILESCLLLHYTVQSALITIIIDYLLAVIEIMVTYCGVKHHVCHTDLAQQIHHTLQPCTVQGNYLA